MKRFLMIVAALFIATVLYARPRVSEEQFEAFINKGSYIKVITLSSKYDSKDISYYNKQSIFKIYLNSYGEIYIFNDSHELAYSLEKEGLEDVKLDADNNLILTYRFNY